MSELDGLLLRHYQQPAELGRTTGRSIQSRSIRRYINSPQESEDSV